MGVELLHLPDDLGGCRSITGTATSLYSLASFRVPEGHDESARVFFTTTCLRSSRVRPMTGMEDRSPFSWNGVSWDLSGSAFKGRYACGNPAYRSPRGQRGSEWTGRRTIGS